MKSSLFTSARLSWALGALLVFSTVSRSEKSPALAPDRVVPVSAQGGAIGKPAPTWTLKNLDGKDVSFADFKGKVVVIDFWATWCGPCRMEIPGYIELQTKYGKDGLVIIGVSLDEKGPAHVKKFAEKNGMNYPLVMGGEEIVAAFGNFTSIPTTFLISREGKIIHEKGGAWDHAQYEELVKKAL